MKSTPLTVSPELRLPVAALLGWLLPGAGHLFIGERVRGLIFMVTITVTFWGGIAVGGVKNTVDPLNRRLWFIGQICAGSHALAAVAWSRQVDGSSASDPSLIAYNRAEEISVVYTAICGMLNVLIILDVLGRAEKASAASSPRPPPAKPQRRPAT